MQGGKIMVLQVVAEVRREEGVGVLYNLGGAGAAAAPSAAPAPA